MVSVYFIGFGYLRDFGLLVADYTNKGENVLWDTGHGTGKSNARRNIYSLFYFSHNKCQRHLLTLFLLLHKRACYPKVED